MQNNTKNMISSILKIFSVSTIILMIIFSLFLANSFLSDKYDPHLITIKMTAQQFMYTPNLIEVHVGDTIRLEITTLDITHGFQLEEFNILNVQIIEGEPTIIEFLANQKGEFKFFCTVFCGSGHPEHIGTLIIT